MANDIQALRGIIFSALEGLTDKQNPLPIDRAKAIAELSQVVINTAKVELDFMRVTKAAGTGFIGEALPPLPGTATEPPPAPAPSTSPRCPAAPSRNTGCAESPAMERTQEAWRCNECYSAHEDEDAA